MSLDPPAYISSLQNNIRARPISWEGAVRAKTITEDDLKMIKAIDKVRKEQRRQTIEGNLDGYCKLLLGGAGSQSIFEAASKRQDIIQYLLVLSGDLIDDIPPLVSKLVQHDNMFAPFLPFFGQSSNPEDPIPLLTSSVLSSLISQALIASSKTPPHIEDALPKLTTYLSGLAKSNDSGLQDIAVQEYSALLRTKESRKLFWQQKHETVDPLVDILRSAAGSADKDNESTLWNGSAGSIRSSAADVGLSGGVSIQLLYHVLLVFWQLSFEAETISKGLDEDYDLIPLYVNLLRLSPKEKTTRLLLSTLRNLLRPSSSNEPSPLLPAASTARLATLLSNLKSRHLTDPDLLDDLSALQNLMTEYTASCTTLSAYAAEIRSGHLRWSPAHRDEKFWAENSKAIMSSTASSEEGELVKDLASILSKSWESDRQVLAVACNDVGWLVKSVPENKGKLERLGVKARVMELMTADDESVRWEALRAVGEWLRYSFEN